MGHGKHQALVAPVPLFAFREEAAGVESRLDLTLNRMTGNGIHMREKNREREAKYSEILAYLKGLSNPAAVAGMARYGINPDRSYGVSMPSLRRLAKQVGTDHALALRLWTSGIREARILAAMIDDPQKVTEAQSERWVADFASWDVCDGCCLCLFVKTSFAYRKAIQWTRRGEEYVKRAGFVLMAQLAVHDKAAADEDFRCFFPIIIRESTDPRNFVRKAVNWALRQIGKRNPALNALAMDAAGEIRRIDSGTARWIAADALRELTGSQVRSRLARHRLSRRPARTTRPSRI